MRVMTINRPLRCPLPLLTQRPLTGARPSGYQPMRKQVLLSTCSRLTQPTL